jgi:hypothetical protein
MNDEPGMGFRPTVSSPKKREVLAPIQNSEPRTINNYFTLVIDPSALLFALMLLVIVFAVIRYAPKMQA